MRTKDATKVWHNPELHTFSKRGGTGGVAQLPVETPEDKRSAKAHRAALEALFAPKLAPKRDGSSGTGTGASGVESGDANGANGKPRGATTSGTSAAKPGRIVLAPPTESDPRATERQKLLGKLLVAEGRPKISKAADDFLKAGFTLPEEQDCYLQLLEHADEEHVRSAIGVLGNILAGELPKRRAVLESRLRRIEQFAEDADTRTAAEALRRRVTGTGGPRLPA